MSATGPIGAGASQRIDFSALRDKLFKKADANRDNALSLEEFTTAGKKVPGGKGGIDEARAKELFSKMDGNADGAASKDEVSAFQQQLITQMQTAMTQLQESLATSGRGGRDEIKGKHGHRPPLSDLFGKIDSDSDGAISKSEFAEFGKSMGVPESGTDKASKLFDTIDKNGDGALSKDEVALFDSSMKAKEDAEKSGKTSQLSALLEAMNAYGAKKTKKTAATNTIASALSIAAKAG